MVRTGVDMINIRFSIGDISLLFSNLYTASISNREPSLRPFIFHSHNHMEFQYILSGEGRLVYEGGNTPFRPGTLLVIPPGVSHRSEADTALVRMTMCMQVFAPGGRELSDTWDLYTALHPSAPVILDPPRGSALEKCLTTLQELIPTRKPDVYATEQLRAHSMLFLLALRPYLPDSGQQDLSASPLSCSAQMVTIDNFFHNRYCTSPPASALARLLHISPRQLNRILKNLYGMNYREKLNATRLKCAMDQLTNTDMPVANISSLLGYGSTTAFGSFIKAQTGMTPSQIRAGATPAPANRDTD